VITDGSIAILGATQGCKGSAIAAQGRKGRGAKQLRRFASGGGARAGQFGTLFGRRAYGDLGSAPALL